MFKGWVISIAIAICYTFAANAQSLRGKVIYVSSSQPVKLKFGSRITNYSFIDRGQAALFKIDHSGKRNLLVSSNARNFRTANLVITEGPNSHLFILEYKELLDAAVENSYDFSSAEKLNAEVQKLKMVLNNSSAREAFGKSTIYIPEFSSSNSTTSAPAANTIGTDHADQPASVKLTNETSNASKLESPVSKTESKSTNKPVAVNNPKPETKQVAASITTPAQTTASASVKTNSASTKTNIPPATPTPPEETHIPDAYELLVHLGDSTAFIAKNYKGSLHWYDSARKLNPQATYPYKQIAAVKQVINEQAIAAQKQRSAKFQSALADYKTADALRVERKFEEAHKGYSKFLSQVDSAGTNEYMPSELYYINQAKDYLARLHPYLPKPKPIAAPVPAEDKKKKKKKKGIF